MMADKVVQRMRRATRFGPDDLTLSIITTQDGERRVSLDIDETTDPIGGRQQAGYLLDRTQIASLVAGLVRAADELHPPIPSPRKRFRQHDDAATEWTAA